MSIVLIGDLSAAAYDVWRAQLSPYLPANETLVTAPECTDKGAVDIALAANPAWGELATYPNLRFVQSLWAGVDGLLADPSLPPNLTIARLVDPAMAQSMAEGAVAAVLFLHRQYPTYLHQQSTHTWRQLSQPMAAHCKVGLLGYGAMGEPVARALATLGFPIHAWGLRPRPDTRAGHAPRADTTIGGSPPSRADTNAGRSLHTDAHASIGYSHGDAGLDHVLAQSQLLINLLPLTATTTGILNAKLFSRLPRGASIINLGRGHHLNDDDLLASLASGHLTHALLDVFHQEPLPPSHPFWSHPQITVLPHVAASTDPESAAPIALQNVTAFRAGGELTGLVSRTRGY